MSYLMSQMMILTMNSDYDSSNDDPDNVFERINKYWWTFDAKEEHNLT